jgi:hypothetical protein
MMVAVVQYHSGGGIRQWSGGANGSGITAVVAHVSTSRVVVPTVVAYVFQRIWVLTTLYESLN